MLIHIAVLQVPILSWRLMISNLSFFADPTLTNFGTIPTVRELPILVIIMKNRNSILEFGERL